jgi:hypothetical protein
VVDALSSFQKTQMLKKLFIVAQVIIVYGIREKQIIDRVVQVIIVYGIS